MNETLAVKVPTVHLNGTSKQSLLDALREGQRAISAAISALYLAMPNDRDYYPQGANAGLLARAEHIARITALERVSSELLAIDEEIEKQGNR